MYPSPTIILLTFLTFGGFTTASIGRFLPYSGFQPIPSKTPGPINIEVSEVKNITTFPLIVLMNGFEIALAKNTGYSVEIFVSGDKTANAIIGGVLGLNIYVFVKFRFYWANSPDGVAASTVNGKDGTALEVCIIYYNLKYGSFRNALNFRDGVIELIYRVKVVGSIPNPLFAPLAGILKQLRKAGSTAKCPLPDTFLNLREYSIFSPFFIYPSAYVNESSGATSYCASEIVTPLNPLHFISVQQFHETFLSLLDDQEKPLVNQAKQAPRGKRPIVQSAGMIKISNFIKFPVKK